jgi:hypothetical protein
MSYLGFAAGKASSPARSPKGGGASAYTLAAVGRIVARRNRIDRVNMRLRDEFAKPEVLPAKRDGYCQRGHKWTKSNTYTRPNGDRECRACRAKSGRRTKYRKYLV